MQQITRKVSCSYTMQNKQKWTRKRNLNTPLKVARPHPPLFPLLVSFVRISALRGRGPVDPKIPLTPETIRTTTRTAREFCLTFSVFMLSRLCSWHHLCGPHCMWFLTMQLQHTLEEGGVGFGYLKSHSSCSQRIFRCWPNFLFMLFTFISNAALFFFFFFFCFSFFFLHSQIYMQIVQLFYWNMFCFVLVFMPCNVSAIWVSFIGLVWGRRREEGKEGGEETAATA